MKQAASYAVCYDITDDRERARVDKTLKGYGLRVQKSVFECHLTRGSKAALIAALSRLALKTGSINIYRIYGGAERTVIGQPAKSDEGFAYVL